MKVSIFLHLKPHFTLIVLPVQSCSRTFLSYHLNISTVHSITDQSQTFQSMGFINQAIADWEFTSNSDKARIAFYIIMIIFLIVVRASQAGCFPCRQIFGDCSSEETPQPRETPLQVMTVWVSRRNHKCSSTVDIYSLDITMDTFCWMSIGYRGMIFHSLIHLFDYFTILMISYPKTYYY